MLSRLIRAVAEVAVARVPDPMMGSKGRRGRRPPHRGDRGAAGPRPHCPARKSRDFKVLAERCWFRDEALPRNPWVAEGSQGGAPGAARLGGGIRRVTCGLSILSAQQHALVDRRDGQPVPARGRGDRRGAAGRACLPARRSSLPPPGHDGLRRGQVRVPRRGASRIPISSRSRGSAPGLHTWAGRLSCREDLARALVVAAVREVFDRKTGLLLAGADGIAVTGENRRPRGRPAVRGVAPGHVRCVPARPWPVAARRPAEPLGALDHPAIPAAPVRLRLLGGHALPPASRPAVPTDRVRPRRVGHDPASAGGRARRHDGDDAAD